ncbi:uncharacterized protein LOC143446758 [Clavelina lepadiformis]|uniref:uncharacterized protein LOC143446758 n=1 Tax=Clavelina lepadiformis TaxID=159417 RepID=UPI0040420B69
MDSEICQLEHKGFSPLPTAGKQEFKEKRKQAAVTAGVGKSHIKKQSNLFSKTTRSVFIAVLSAGLIALIVAIVLSTLPRKKAAEEAACKSLEASLTSKEPRSPADVYLCSKISCEFDVTTCSEACPFGFAEDKNIGCPIDCTCATSGTFEGDIQFNDDDIPRFLQEYLGQSENSFSVYAGSTAKLEEYKWPLGEDKRIKLPYKLRSDLDASVIEAVQQAGRWLATNTCVDFIPWTDEKIYLDIVPASYCGSEVGRDFKRQFGSRPHGQLLALSTWCNDVSVVLHQLMHALGFYHEHSRPDQEAYITVNEDDIPKAQAFSYRMKSAEEVVNIGYEYNIKSHMHYTSDKFMAAGKYAFVKTSDGQPHLENSKYPDDNDIAELADYYKCSVTESATEGSWTEWGEWSKCDDSCGNGNHWRYRKCVDNDEKPDFDCVGKSSEWKECTESNTCSGEYGEWGQWGVCTVSCGASGRQARSRNCIPYGACGRKLTDLWDQRDCNTEACEDDGDQKDIESSWTEWGPWKFCPEKEVCETRIFVDRYRTCLTNLYQKSPLCEVSGNDTIKKTGLDIGQGVQTKVCKCNKESEVTSSTTTLTTAAAATTNSPIAEVNPNAEIFGKLGGFVGFKLCSFGDETLNYPTWHFGDYNGDKRTDVICADSVNASFALSYTNKDGYITKIDDSGRWKFCQERYVGDFNDDGKDDILCRGLFNSEITIALAKDDGINSNTIVVGEFCVGLGDVIITHDANGDGKSDVICHRADGKLETHLNIYNW